MTQARSSGSSAQDAKPKGEVGEAPRALPQGLSPEDLVEFYRKMVLIRATDERIWMMNRQGKVPIAASEGPKPPSEIDRFARWHRKMEKLMAAQTRTAKRAPAKRRPAS